MERAPQRSTNAAIHEPMSFGARIAELGATVPHEVAFVAVAVDGSEETMTWADADRRSNQLGRAFTEAGLARGDRVAIELQNSAELVLAVLASWKLGAVPVPMRWDLPEWEKARLLEVVDGQLVLDPPTIAALGDRAAELSAAPLPDVLSPQVNGICSSGSTGLPKVILADRPAVWLADSYAPFASAWGPVERPQTILVPGPLYHTNGFSTLFSMLTGDKVLILEKFDAWLILDLIKRHRVTTFTATPTMLQRLANVADIDTRDLSSIVFVLQGAAAMAPSLARAWIRLIGAERLYMAYGMTEGLGLASLRGDEWLTKPGSVGPGFRGTEIRIQGPDGAILGPGEIGEIYLRSPTTGSYAYRGGAALLPMTADGFGSAGDLGHIDEDGFLYIADRRVDLIISGGANVYPAEVEAALIDHPAIADVVVIGLRDTDWGRRVHAIVEPHNPAQPPSTAEVIAYAKERLAPYKVPKTVEIVAVMPRSAATKVNRSALVDERGG